MAEGNLSAPVEREPGELGVVADALVSLRDQVRAKIAELEAGQAVLRTVLDGLPDAVFLLEGDRVQYASSAAGRMFAPPAAGWEGSWLSSPPLPAPLAAAIAEGRTAGEPSTAELGPDPLMRFLRVTTLPLDPVGRGSRTLVVVSDVTDRRRLDVVRRDFVSNASHELKTPAAAIQLLADSASAAAADGDVDHALGFVDRMKEEADRLRRLVVDLLDLSRLETTPDPGSVTDIRAAVDLAVTGHRSAASAAGLALIVDAGDVRGEDVYVSADPTDMAVALDNLLANAITYTVAGSVTLELGTDDSHVTVLVADTGPGIPPEHLPRVFERFYRVDAARTRDAGGTGLGLSLVRNAVERSGGSVDIRSTVGGGTVVTLRLPRAR
jgi:two-component system phosphate regulon sensor histidine kinase PhoR